MAKIIKSYSELAPNDSYELMYERYLDDIKSSGIILRHKKSGARVAVLSNEDKNKLFCAAFRTPPSNSTGVPHIIEHSVLNGSKNFPSRDPFMQLAKGSLNTFLNAMTYPDKTIYPVATCNDKDFENLMHVYMDAVFYPNIYKHPFVFMQEGWHYELNDAEDELKINGVVYSEMKGASSSPDDAAWSNIGKAMFPDTTYGVNSGGDPDVIPELTYEQFTEFHRSHYHPSNSYIFLYGDCDMDERLRFMDREYLSHFDAIDPHSEVARQPHFNQAEPKRIHATYSVGQTDPTDGKAYLVYATMGGSNLDAEEATACQTLAYVLFNADGAPVKQALLDAGIGEDVFGFYDSHQIDDAFSVCAKYAKAEDTEKFYNIIMDVLKEQVEKGVNEKAITAALNSREFGFREANYNGYPRGLDVACDMLQSWLYDDSAAFTYMSYLDCFAKAKAKVGTGYYEDLIKKYFFDTDHNVLITIEPEQGLIDKKNAALKEKLAAYKASLTPEQVQKIVDDTKALREYQSHEPTPEELNCIPVIDRADIPRETIPFYNEETTVGGVKTVYHDVDTSGITYMQLFFDIGKLPQKYIPYLTLLRNILGRVDTANHNYNELNVDIMLNLGGLWTGHTAYNAHGRFDEYKPYFWVYAKSLSDKAPLALELAEEMIKTSKFDDTKRLRDILAELKANKRNEIISSGNSVAIRRAFSYFSKYQCYLQLTDGLDYYLFICDLLDHFDEKAPELVENLTKVRDYVFSCKDTILSLSADKAGIEAVDKSLPKFMESLSTLPHPDLGEFVDFVPEKKNEGILVPSQVQYVGLAGNLGFDGISYNGVMQVVKTAVNADWLYQQIRVKGGAYGCGVGFGGANGSVQFSSYRDPKLKETLEVYKGTGKYVRECAIDEKELNRFVIGTFSGYERPLSASGKADRSMSAYMTGCTYEDVLRERAEMLDVTIEQFKATADLFDKICAQGCYCAVGNETKLKENADMFGSLITIN